MALTCGGNTTKAAAGARGGAGRGGYARAETGSARPIRFQRQLSRWCTNARALLTRCTECYSAQTPAFRRPPGASLHPVARRRVRRSGRRQRSPAAAACAGGEVPVRLRPIGAERNGLGFGATLRRARLAQPNALGSTGMAAECRRTAHGLAIRGHAASLLVRTLPRIPRAVGAEVCAYECVFIQCGTPHCGGRTGRAPAPLEPIGPGDSRVLTWILTGTLVVLTRSSPCRF